MSQRPGSGSALAARIAATTTDFLGSSPVFDAIVVGAGASGGLAAMELTRAGLRVLTLDAGWRKPVAAAPLNTLTQGVVRSLADPKWYGVLPPAVTNLGRKALRAAGRLRQPVQSKCFAWMMAPDAFVDDRDAPYETDPEARFLWFRARQLGGRMTIPGHGRQYYRLSNQDFAANGDGRPVWPLSPGEMAAWYLHVEEQLGLSGGPQPSTRQPGSRLASRYTPTAAETDMLDRLQARWPDASPILGQSAPPLDSLSIAAETNRLWVRRGAIVRRVSCGGPQTAKCVSWHDCETGVEMRARAPLVFLCASAIETTRILLSSSAPGSPEGIGQQSGVLGRGLMDHVLVSGDGVGPALPGGHEPLTPGRTVFLPRFDLRDAQVGASGVPFGVQVYRSSLGKKASNFTAVSFAEMAPNPDNRVELHPTRKDRFGNPILRITCRHSAAELAVAKEQSEAIREIADLSGVKLHRFDAAPAIPGTAMHECGTARMGATPETSVLNPWNECWDAPGLYVTDAASFPTQGIQNPTLTIMALTARAVAKATGSAVRPVNRDVAMAS
jgi:choline dehydrogenase-like flavoprotein